MNNNIYNFAIQNGEINKDVLCNLCDQMDEDKRRRFVEAILGIVDIAEVTASLPSESKNRNGVVRRLESYSYLDGIVYYSYDEDVKRYFKDEEKADNFARTGNSGYSSDWEYQLKEDYVYPAVHTYERSNSCPLAEWCQA